MAAGGLFTPGDIATGKATIRVARIFKPHFLQARGNLAVAYTDWF